MSETRAIQRPRLAVLGFAAVVLLAVLVYALWPAATPEPGPSNQPRVQQPVTPTAGNVQGPLDVRLGELQQPPPEPGGEGRNPFRFYVKPPPPPPAAPRVPKPGEKGYVAPPPPPPPGPPPIPPIPLKFTGTMEQGKKKVAIFSDGRGLPVYASEGELVLGQYRVVRIQLESVVMEYANGSGRQTIPMRGAFGDIR
jgi:hypothetical protein